jgi:hypothetical protein
MTEGRAINQIFRVTFFLSPGKSFPTNKVRWLSEWRMAAGKPVLCHVHSLR